MKGEHAMKPTLKLGLSRVGRVVVDRDRTVGFMGEASRVYSTPSLVHDIEDTCRNLLLEHVDAGEDSVGMDVAIRQTAPTLLGMAVEISVTVTATDARNLTGTGNCSVGVEVPPPPPMCSKINSIQFPDLKRPWRVDNTAKAILDDVASRLKADPNAKIVIVGYADGEKAPMIGTGKNRHPMNLAAQRAVNAKAYLVQQQGIDPSRIGVSTGTGQQKVADIIWVPQGADESKCADLQNTTPVDESVVKPSANAYPKPRKAPATPHHHKKAAPAGEAATPPPQP